MTTVVDVQSALSAVQAQIAAIQAAVAAGPSASGDSGFAAALAATTADASTTASGTSTTAASTTTAATSTATATASAGTLATNGTTGHDVAEDALKYVGVPYVFGGESTSGMDCSGLVQKVFGDLGVSVPRLVHEQQTVGTAVDSLKDAKPGDLIVLNGGDHVAIYLGNDTVIHAPYAGRSVSVQKVWFGDKDITAIRRVVPSDSTSTASTTSATDLSTAAQLLALQGDSGTSTGTSTGSLTGTSTGTTGSSLSTLLSGLGSSSSSSSSTAQQLLAARAALLSGASA